MRRMEERRGEEERRRGEDSSTTTDECHLIPRASWEAAMCNAVRLLWSEIRNSNRVVFYLHHHFIPHYGLIGRDYCHRVQGPRLRKMLILSFLCVLQRTGLSVL